MTQETPKPYLPRPWQLPHMLATPIGGKVLIVERCGRQPPDSAALAYCWGNNYSWSWGSASTESEALAEACRQITDGDSSTFKCLLGPIGTVLSVEGVGDFRIDGIDLRRTDTMTEGEALAWGIVMPGPSTIGDDSNVIYWLTDNPGATWGDWGWFYEMTRTDR